MSSTKHLRLSIDFHITIADTPPLLREGMIEPPDPEYDARQARLLEAIKNSPETLQRWINDLIAFKMFAHSSSDWFDLLSGGEVPLHEMLAPALAMLPENDQEFFQDWAETGNFDVVTDMVEQSFVVTEDKPIVAVRFERTAEESEP